VKYEGQKCTNRTMLKDYLKAACCRVEQQVHINPGLREKKEEERQPVSRESEASCRRQEQGAPHTARGGEFQDGAVNTVKGFFMGRKLGTISK
jgi:hypothetical protein